MIIIVAKSIVKEGKAEQYKTLAKELVEKSRKEEGCLAYNLYQDLNNKNVLTMIEEWKDKEAVEVHNRSIHFTTIVPKLGELREDSEINLYVRV